MTPIIQPMSVRGPDAGTFRSSAEVSRSVTASAVYLRSGLASPTTIILDKRKTPDGFVDSQRSDSVCVSVRDAFSIPLQAIPKTDLSTFVLELMIYLMSY